MANSEASLLSYSHHLVHQELKVTDSRYNEGIETLGVQTQKYKEILQDPSKRLCEAGSVVDLNLHRRNTGGEALLVLQLCEDESATQQMDYEDPLPIHDKAIIFSHHDLPEMKNLRMVLPFGSLLGSPIKSLTCSRLKDFVDQY
jgi:hypothetical protein